MSREQDRTGFYRKMVENPLDKLPRLVFRDYLEEGGAENDLDRATVEFIRLSCGEKTEQKMYRMPGKSYEWLEEHDRFLVPSFYTESRSRKLYIHKIWRQGRFMNYRLRTAKMSSAFIQLRFEWYYGFLKTVEFQMYPMDADLISSFMRAILADQPLATRLPPWPRFTRAPRPEFAPGGNRYYFTPDVSPPQLIFNEGFTEQSWTDGVSGNWVKTPVYRSVAYSEGEAETEAFELCILDAYQAYQRLDASVKHAACRHNPEELPVDLSHFDRMVRKLGGNFAFASVCNLTDALSHRRVGSVLQFRPH